MLHLGLLAECASCSGPYLSFFASVTDTTYCFCLTNHQLICPLLASLFVSWDRISLCSPGCLGVHCVDWASLEPAAIWLPLPPGCRGFSTWVSHHHIQLIPGLVHPVFLFDTLWIYSSWFNLTCKTWIRNCPSCQPAACFLCPLASWSSQHPLVCTYNASEASGDVCIGFFLIDLFYF